MTKPCKISAINKDKRMSTQELLQLIYDKVEKGITDFEIDACGQHDIAGALWAKDRNKKLNFIIKNPGQRVGAMALKNTKITVLDSTPADVGWLNSGAEITVKKDAGDTAAHCAAGGKIYIGGRAGTRSGALMKHDPKFNPPEFWVLKNTGSFSFEFMGGGIGVVCGYECEDMDSVLGNRSAAGMVGGIIYVRGNVQNLSPCAEILKLDNSDKEFLKKGLLEFLNAIERKELYTKLTKFSEWRKISPLKNQKKQEKISISDFKKTQWFNGGLFKDMVEDDGRVYSLCESNEARLKKPVWEKSLCKNCSLCEKNCPQSAISNENKIYTSDANKCIGCSICSVVCPFGAWKMEHTK